MDREDIRKTKQRRKMFVRTTKHQTPGGRENTTRRITELN